MLALLCGPLPLLILLVNQPNFGNAMVTVGVTLIILFVAGVSDRWMLRAAAGAAGGRRAGAYFFVGKMNRLRRLDGLPA